MIAPVTKRNLSPALALFLLGGCVLDAPLPDLGACAEPPEGVYEYGQIGIGTCLSGPNDLVFLDEGRILAVTNANPWKDFTGGSALFLDLSTVDYSLGRNVIAPAGTTDGVSAKALDMPSFSGPMDYAASRGLLLVTNRLSEGARTREAFDDLWFIDVSDPSAPAFADDLGPDGPTLPVGYDPVAVHYAPSTDLAWVVNRTAHTVAIVDMAASPVALVPPGGPARLEEGDFTDVDGSGSHAGFVALQAAEIPEGAEPDRVARVWDLDWNVGTLRAWIPSADGAYRVTGNGETLWTRAAAPVDLDLADADGEVLAVQDPHFFLENPSASSAISRMVFVDQGLIRAADATDALEAWGFEEPVLLEPSSGWDAELGGPDMIVEDGTWYLFYDGGSGADHAVGLAASSDGVNFSRVDDAPLFAIDGASVTDPFVLWDDQTNRWRMYYTLDGASIGEATSEDLTDWTVAGSWAPPAGAWAPVVGYINGRFHLYYSTVGADGDGLAEAVSVDGSTWTELGTPFTPDAGSDLSGGIALQVAPEEDFVLTDQGGDSFPVTVVPGATEESLTGGWALRVAVGQVADPADIDMAGLRLDSVYDGAAWFTYTDDSGVSSIGTGTLVGDDVLPASGAVLEAGAGGDHDAVGAASPVVTEIGGQWVMYYAAIGEEITTIGRATSDDAGLTWTADTAPVLTGAADWESVAVEPGSVQVLDDGTIRLWYTAFDGTNYRIGLAESSDGAAFTRVPGPLADWAFGAGAPGDWYDNGVRDPYVVRDGDIDRMWFTGDSGTATQIGYAERASDDDEWASATSDEGTERPVLAAALGGFGIGGVGRPVVLPSDTGWTLWYTGLDGAQGRVGRAVGVSVDRFHRDLRMPTVADAWSFTTVPAREGETLSLDLTVDGGNIAGGGCSAIAEDEDRGFLYVGCKLVPYVYVVDIRDDSTAGFDDLNYLDVESVILIETSTGSDSGMRGLVVDRDRGWLWGIADEPEAIYAIDLTLLEDNADVELLREQVVAMLPLPRAGSRGGENDQGPETQSSVGPANLAFHPDGRHLVVTNFNGNSVSAYDLAVGPVATLVAQTDGVGENPYALRFSPDGSLLAVANYAGEVEDAHTASSIALLDGDPTSPTFLQAKTWLVNK